MDSRNQQDSNNKGITPLIGIIVFLIALAMMDVVGTTIYHHSANFHHELATEYQPNPNQLSKSTAESFFTNMADSADRTANHDNSDGNNDLANEFQNGVNNNAYQKIDGWAKAMHQNSHIFGIDSQVVINSINSQADNANVDVTIKNNFHDDQGYNQVKDSKWNFNLIKSNSPLAHWQITSANQE